MCLTPKTIKRLILSTYTNIVTKFYDYEKNNVSLGPYLTHINFNVEMGYEMISRLSGYNVFYIGI